MKHVYQNALLNIAATASRNSRTGLFFKRDPSLTPISKVEVRWDEGLPCGEYCLYPNTFWINGVTSAPLNRRAWVLQERLLARRILHFGSYSLFFECCEHEACETFPKGLPSILCGNNNVNKFKHIYTLEDSTSHNLREQYHKWARVVESFLESDLTKASDKAISLSGIAEEFQQHFIKQPYIAGLLQEAFEEQLLWWVSGERQRNGSSSQRPTVYRATSWSWLSIDGNVSLAALDFEPTLIEIKNFQIELIDKNNPTGQIKDGNIVVRAHLLRATQGVRKSSDPNIAPDYLLFDGRELGRTQVLFDEAAGKPAKDEIMFCLPVRSRGEVIKAEGLLLSPIGKQVAEYRRIGLFRAHDADFTDLLNQQSDDSKRTFTII